MIDSFPRSYNYLSVVCDHGNHTYTSITHERNYFTLLGEQEKGLYQLLTMVDAGAKDADAECIWCWTQNFKKVFGLPGPQLVMCKPSQANVLFHSASIHPAVILVSERKNANL